MSTASDEFKNIKIVVVGDSGTGKSAFITRYCTDEFKDNERTTIGVDFLTKRLSVHGRRYKVQLLDTAGQERYRTLSTSYYRNAHAVIVIFSLVSRSSFDSLPSWFKEVAQHTSECVTYLVGSKLDLAEREEAQRAVGAEEARAVAEKYGASGYCEVSSKQGVEVRKPFVDVVEEVDRRPELLVRRGTAMKAIELDTPLDGKSVCTC